MTDTQDTNEPSAELKAVLEVSEEITSHSSRLKKLHATGSLKEVLADELIATIFPLLDDFAKAGAKHSQMLEESLEDVEITLEENGGGVPDLAPSEIEIFEYLINQLQSFVMGSRQQAGNDLPPEAAQALLEIEVKLNMGRKILERLSADGQEEETELESSTGTEGGTDSGD